VSIAPPSDIILDVAQAADPLRLQAAQAKLARMSGASGSDFSAVLDGAGPHAAAGSTLASHALAFEPAIVTTHPASPYQKFEAVMLQNFLQDILPKDENLFGDAASADAVRSLLAEQLAGQLAKSGKFGVARMIEAAHGGQPAHVATLTPTDGTPPPAGAPAAAPPAKTE
jgi:flagellar protein FlgJ